MTNIKYLQSSQRTQIVLPENQNLPLIAEISMYDIQAFTADRFTRDQFSIEVLAVVGQVGPSPIHVQENHQFQLPTQSIFEAPKVNFPSWSASVTIIGSDGLWNSAQLLACFTDSSENTFQLLIQCKLQVSVIYIDQSLCQWLSLSNCQVHRWMLWMALDRSCASLDRTPHEIRGSFSGLWGLSL